MRVSDWVGTVMVVIAFLVCMVHTPAHAGSVHGDKIHVNYHPHWNNHGGGTPNPTNGGGGGAGGGAAGSPITIGPVTGGSVGPVTATGGSIGDLTVGSPTASASIIEAPTTATATTGPVSAVGGGAVGNQTSYKAEAKRGLAQIPGTGGPAEARFREDDRYESDWRVVALSEIIKDQRVWPLEEGVKLSANLDKSKMHKNLHRVMNNPSTSVEFVDSPPTPKEGEMLIWLGFIPMSPDLKRGGLIAWLSDDGPNDLTAMNLVGNTVVAACAAGATHLVRVKDGFIRGGHSEVGFLGIAGGGSSVFEDGKKAGGVSGSIGPSQTTMDAWDMDRPFTLVKAYCLVPKKE